MIGKLIWSAVAIPLKHVHIHTCNTILPFPTHIQFGPVQSLSRVRLFATPWIAARQASLSITNISTDLYLEYKWLVITRTENSKKLYKCNIKIDLF